MPTGRRSPRAVTYINQVGCRASAPVHAPPACAVRLGCERPLRVPLRAPGLVRVPLGHGDEGSDDRRVSHGNGLRARCRRADRPGHRARRQRRRHRNGPGPRELAGRRRARRRVSETNPQLAGPATTDGDGRYTISNLIVGSISVRAVKGATIGSGTTRIQRAARRRRSTSRSTPASSASAAPFASSRTGCCRRCPACTSPTA